jgi:hypothetical protein
MRGLRSRKNLDHKEEAVASGISIGDALLVVVEEA